MTTKWTDDGDKIVGQTLFECKESDIGLTPETERKLFEEWFARNFGQGKKPFRSERHDGYFYDTTDRAWQAWLYRSTL